MGMPGVQLVGVPGLSCAVEGGGVELRSGLAAGMKRLHEVSLGVLCEVGSKRNGAVTRLVMIQFRTSSVL